MAPWKIVDLTNFNTVPLTELKAGKKYIMYGYREFWPKSRWIVIFKHLLEGGQHVKIDVLDIKLQYGSTNDTAHYLGEDQVYSATPFVFYDYDDIFKMKTIMETGRKEQHRIPPLASMAQYQLPSIYIPTAKKFDQLGLNSLKDKGGKKTRRKKTRRRTNKNKRKTYRYRKIEI
jgi:hypothetical protein